MGLRFLFCVMTLLVITPLATAQGQVAPETYVFLPLDPELPKTPDSIVLVGILGVLCLLAGVGLWKIDPKEGNCGATIFSVFSFAGGIACIVIAAMATWQLP